MISSQEEAQRQFLIWACNFFEKDKKLLLKDKLQAEQTKLLWRYKQVHEGLVVQVVKQISFLIFKFFLSISMKTYFSCGLSQFEEKKLYYFCIRPYY